MFVLFLDFFFVIVKKSVDMDIFIYVICRWIRCILRIYVGMKFLGYRIYEFNLSIEC